MSALCIAFEGSDGAGKQTQTDLVAQLLAVGMGLKVTRVSFPRYQDTTGGKLLYEVMKSERSPGYSFSKLDPYSASLLYAMDRAESKDWLRDLISTHDVVVFDRYVESNLLHQGGKFGSPDAREIFSEWLFDLEYRVLGLPKPDQIIYLEIPFWLSRKRAKLRQDSGGPAIDAVEKDIDYVKQGHEAGVFYATMLGWSVVSGFEDGKELTVNEVHEKVMGVLHLP